MTTETVILSQLSENKANPRKITEDKNYPMASRIIKDTLEAKLIKEENSEGSNRHNYIPYWA
jgi:hypothetical protein